MAFNTQQRFGAVWMPVRGWRFAPWRAAPSQFSRSPRVARRSALYPVRWRSKVCTPASRPVAKSSKCSSGAACSRARPLPLHQSQRRRRETQQKPKSKTQSPISAACALHLSRLQSRSVPTLTRHALQRRWLTGRSSGIPKAGRATALRHSCLRAARFRYPLSSNVRRHTPPLLPSASP